MKKTTAFLVLAALLSGCRQDRFALVDPKSGAELGRFTYRTGEKVTIDGKSYQIKKVGTHEGAVEQHLRLTIVPEFCCRQAQPQDLLDFLRDCLFEFEPTNSPFRRAISMEIVPAPNRTNEVPLMDLYTVEDTSVFELLKSLAELSGGRLRINGNRVWIYYDK
ncbi:hypothetical protein ACFLQU_04795 [Verrucomicrobiota bacterium]